MGRGTEERSGKKRKHDCSGPLGHQFSVSGEFFQNVVGTVRLKARCVECKKRFVVPVVREMDREVVGDTGMIRISRPARSEGGGR